MISTISHFHLLFAPLPHPTGRFLVKTLSSSRYVRLQIVCNGYFTFFESPKTRGQKS